MLESLDYFAEKGLRNYPPHKSVPDDCGCAHSDGMWYEFAPQIRIHLSHLVLTLLCTFENCGCKFDGLTSRKPEAFRN